MGLDEGRLPPAPLRETSRRYRRTRGENTVAAQRAGLRPAVWSASKRLSAAPSAGDPPSVDRLSEAPAARTVRGPQPRTARRSGAVFAQRRTIFAAPGQDLQAGGRGSGVSPTTASSCAAPSAEEDHLQRTRACRDPNPRGKWAAVLETADGSTASTIAKAGCHRPLSLILSGPRAASRSRPARPVNP